MSAPLDATRFPLADARPPRLATVAAGAITGLAPSRLLVAFLAVVVLRLLGAAFDLGYVGLIGGIAPVGPPSGGWNDAASSVPFPSGSPAFGGVGGARADELGPAATLNATVRTSADLVLDGVASLRPEVVAAGVRAFPAGLAASFDQAPWGTVVWGMIALTAAAVFAGGLARAAVVEAGRGTKLELASLARWWRGRIVSLALLPWPPFAVTAGVFLAAWLVALPIGWASGVPFLGAAVALAFGVVLALMLLAAIVGGAALLGAPFAVAASACGDADPLDATVRASAYLLRRPFRALAVAATSLASVGAVGVVLATLATGVLAASRWAVSIDAIGVDPTARTVVDAWSALFVLAIIAALASCLVDCAARGYLLLRCENDGQDPSALDGVPLARPA
jgi:hypothetical protein